MAIKTKYNSPSINEFSPNDIIINVSEGALFFKSHNKLYRLAGDDVGTFDTQEAGIFYIGMDTNPPGSAEGTATSWGAVGGSNPGLNTAPTYAVNTNVKADIHIGAQQGPAYSTTNSVSQPRIAIQPPCHTGGPFSFYARDTDNLEGQSGHAHLDMFYGSGINPSSSTSFNAKNNILTLNHRGHVSIGGRWYMEETNKQNIGTFSVHQNNNAPNGTKQGWGSTSFNNVIAQGNDTEDKWYLIGYVGFNHGAINIKGFLGGHTQGDATVDITYTLRDKADGLYGGGSYNPDSAHFPDIIRQTGMVSGEVGTGSDIEVFMEYSGSQYNPGGHKRHAPELITNGNFNDDSSWTQEATGWDIGSGVATFSGADYKWFGQGPLDVEAGKFYVIKFTNTTTQHGSVVVYLGGNTTADNFNTHILDNGEQEIILECGTSNNALRFYPGAGNEGTRWNGTIDNVSIKEANCSSANRKWIYLRADQYAVCNLDFKSTTGTKLLWDGTYTTKDPKSSFAYSDAHTADLEFNTGSAEHTLSTHNVNLQLDGIGDVRIVMDADRDNDGEGGNPYIHMLQDGRLIDTMVGMAGDFNDDPNGNLLNGGWQNSFQIVGGKLQAGSRPPCIQLANSGSVRLTVGQGGGVGIGDVNTTSEGTVASNNPEFPLEVMASATFNNNFVPSSLASGGSDQSGTPAYHIARFINNYTGTANEGNGVRIKLGSTTTADGISTSRKFLLFENGRTTDSLYIQGSIAGLGETTRGVNFSTSSDKRLKENIVQTQYSIKDLMKVKVRDFNWIGSTTLTNGFIAQELIKVYPLAVSHPHDDLVGDGPLKPEETWTVDYGKITPLLTKAIQDQQKMIEELQKEIKEIKDGISRK